MKKNGRKSILMWTRPRSLWILIHRIVNNDYGRKWTFTRKNLILN
jgi:hypothetical protein